MAQTHEDRIQNRINKFLFARRYGNKDDEKREMREWINTLTHRYSPTQVRDILLYIHSEIDPNSRAVEILTNEKIIEDSTSTLRMNH